MEERLKQNLRKLTRHVETSSPVELADGSHGASPQTLGQRIAQGLPLAHATGQASFLSVLELHYLRPEDSTEDQIAFVRSHELPVPDYRRVFGGLLDAFFHSPWDYIDGKGPLPTWPIPVAGGDWRRWTFEVRFRDEIRLSGSLLAIFLPIAVASEPRVLRRIARWRQEGVEVKMFRTPRADDWQILQGLSVEYLKGYMS